MIRIASAQLEATVAPLGAELQTLRDAEGRDWLWDGDPAFWTGRAPILFPVVGMLRDGGYRLDGKTYVMEKHGFARRRAFTAIEQADDAVTLRLEADAETRASYPFDFALAIRFAVAGTTLEMSATVANHGDTAMPASFGFHPALRWPLPGGRREDQTVRFEHPEREPVRRIDQDGLLLPQGFANPVEGDALRLDDTLFVDDALIFDGLWSRACTLETPGAPRVRIEWPGMPLLGIWTKPGAGYICIEPWQGIADPVGQDGDLRDKPGIVEIAPGAHRSFTMRITVGAS